MPRNRKINTFGDTVQDYKHDELVDLYLSEGKSEEEANKLADSLFHEFKTLNNQTKDFWKKYRIS